LKKYSEYNAEDNYKSRYFYSGTDTYINKFGIKDRELLMKVEADLTNQRLYELYCNPLKGDFSLEHLLKVHEYIFHDLYCFAGKIREENIQKDDTLFCDYLYISKNLSSKLNELKAENFLSSINFKEFIKRISYYYSELNIIHPFREGNGRAIREFIRTLGLRNKFYIEWKESLNKEHLEAVIYSVFVDTTKLEGYFSKIITY